MEYNSLSLFLSRFMQKLVTSSSCVCCIFAQPTNSNALHQPLCRAVASMYSWGGVSQKFPNDEENFRIFHGIRSQDAIYKQKYT
jgi:hypothetical protein